MFLAHSSVPLLVLITFGSISAIMTLLPRCMTSTIRVADLKGDIFGFTI